MSLAFKIKILLIIVFLNMSCDFARAEKKATAANPNVDVYSQANFDSEILEVIQPGHKYTISEKPQGPFYKIRLKNGKVGYVPDTELDIDGVGQFQQKPFLDDMSPADLKKNKKKSSQKNKESFPEEDDDEDLQSPESEKLSYHGLTFQLINYHEDTLGGVQIGDLYAFGYRHLPMLNDFSSSFAWDFAAAVKAPDYYAKKTGFAADGYVLWLGSQIINVTGMGSNMTLRYGAGPFAKYSHFDVQSATKEFALQDLTVGVTLEAGVILHTQILSFDFGLRYYWDKEPYGGLGFAILF